MYAKSVFANLYDNRVFTFHGQPYLRLLQSLPHPDVMAALEIGHRVLIGDGKLVVVVREVSEPKGEWVKTEVMNDATLGSRRGFNLPDTFVPGSALTPKDIMDLYFCLKNIDFNWVALSFVQEAGDIMQLRELMGDHPGKVIASLWRLTTFAPSPTCATGSW